jgi:AcrR family transcriptional regulator
MHGVAAGPATERRGRGRPPEDRLQRQWEIYLAVSPLILRHGIKALPMREAAAAACLSVGGLYHYFADKRDMALFGLRPDVLERRCREWHLRHDHLAAVDPRAYFDAYVEFSIAGHAFVRPAVIAALELGAETLWPSLELAINSNNAELAEAVRPLLPGTPAAEQLESVARQLRRMTFGAVLDRTITAEEFRAGLRGLLAAARAPD